MIESAVARAFLFAAGMFAISVTITIVILGFNDIKGVIAAGFDVIKNGFEEAVQWILKKGGSD